MVDLKIPIIISCILTLLILPFKNGKLWQPPKIMKSKFPHDICLSKKLIFFFNFLKTYVRRAISSNSKRLFTLFETAE